MGCDTLNTERNPNDAREAMKHGNFKIYCGVEHGEHTLQTPRYSYFRVTRRACFGLIMGFILLFKNIMHFSEIQCTHVGQKSNTTHTTLSNISNIFYFCLTLSMSLTIIDIAYSKNLCFIAL